MSGNKYDIVDMAEEAAEGIIDTITFMSRIFYNASGISSLEQSMTKGSADRFKNRILKNIDIWHLITDTQKKNFFDGLKDNPQNVNYLYEFFENIRTTMYELHSKLLFRLLVNLVKNKGLTYFESNLLANINTFNDEDIKIVYTFLKEYENENDDAQVKFNFNNFNYTNTFKKFIQIGIIAEMTGGLNFGKDVKKRNVPEFTYCYLTPNSKELLIMLDDIIGADDITI